MSIRAACTAYRITQALHLARTLGSMVELSAPFPPRRPTSRDMTLTTSLRVIARELEKALSDLDQMDQMEVRRVG
jgi:hypothetical protein